MPRIVPLLLLCAAANAATVAQFRAEDFGAEWRAARVMAVLRPVHAPTNGWSAPGGTASLTAELLVGEECVLSASMPVLVAPVEEFYRWWNFRHFLDGGETRATDSSDPLAFPDSASDGSSVVFVHGFRVDETAARAWNAEMFKRLWQSGCNARFHAVDWYGNEGVGNGGLDYHGNVENAFRTAPHLKTFLSGFSADTTVLAHSLGNMVVCSAIQDWNWRPARYFMLNAAVPAEAFSPAQWNIDETDNPFEFEDWVGFPSKTWAARWHELFPETDWRSKLTWKNRFADVPARTELHNFYSSGDEVLAIFDMPDPDGSGKITLHPLGAGGAGISSWQKQERFKGRWGSSLVGGFAGTSEMGWGFSSQGYYEDGSPPLYQTVIDPTKPSNAVVVRTAPYGTNAAANASTAQLLADPVFNHAPPAIFSANFDSGDIDRLLARGVPALSGPVGRGEIGNLAKNRQKDMNSIADELDWPRAGEDEWQGWRHSDMKSVALPFVKSAFGSILQ